MARYIDADRIPFYIRYVDDGQENDLKKIAFAAEIASIPAADVVPTSEAEKWYHEYHVIKDELKRERAEHRATEKLADRYLVELKTAKRERTREEDIKKMLYLLREIHDGHFAGLCDVPTLGEIAAFLVDNGATFKEE